MQLRRSLFGGFVVAMNMVAMKAVDDGMPAAPSDQVAVDWPGRDEGDCQGEGE